MYQFSGVFAPLSLFFGLIVFIRMPDHPSSALVKAISAFMRPIARILLRSGVGYRQFDQIARQAFVQVASEEFGIRGRPTNISRIAIMTGLTRKEVRSLKELDDSIRNAPVRDRTIAAEVLHLWNTNQDFLSSSGEPAALIFSGEKHSFTSLVKLCAADIPAGAMRAELKRVGAVIEKDNGDLVPIRREIVPIDAESRLIEGFRFGLAPLATTISHNSVVSDNIHPRFQRVVHSEKVQRNLLDQATNEIRSKLIGISEQLDDSLSNYESLSDVADTEELVDLGVGLYYFVRDDRDKLD